MGELRLKGNTDLRKNTKPTREGDRPPPLTLADAMVSKSDAPLVDSALAGIRDRRTAQAAAVGTGRPRRAKGDENDL